MEGFSGLGSVVGAVLEFFGQKVWIYVEVSFNNDPPYCLKVVNRSRYEVEINEVIADPDGFPETNNGWHLSESNLFKNKRLKPGQKIKFYLKRDQIGHPGQRKFAVKYNTILKGRAVPRKEQSCEHYFDLSQHGVSVHTSINF
jgi:hypothetical protein